MTPLGSLPDIFRRVNLLARREARPVYVVGGYLRDWLLGESEEQDIDFVVDGSGLEFARAFDAAVGQQGSLVEFEQFDTARYVIPDLGSAGREVVLEFAGARTEAYHPASRKPRVESATLAEDLARRDFTVNSLAAPVAAFAGRRPLTLAGLRRQLIDPLNGQADLEQKILRTPLDPQVTFREDPLRMLRAARFAAQLHFGIARETLQAMHEERARLAIVSAERLQDELLRLLATPRPSVGLVILFQTGLLDLILPEVAALDGVEEIYGHQHKNNLVHSFKVVDNIAGEAADVWLRLAGLLHDIGKPGTKRFMPRLGWTFHAHEHLGRKLVRALGRRLRFPVERIEYLARLIRWHMQPIQLMDEGITDAAVRRLVVTLGPELEDLLILGRSDVTTGNPYKRAARLKNYERLKTRIAAVIAKDKLRAFQSPVRGEEIMAESGLKPGPTVGKIKEAIEEAILDGKIPNEYQAAHDYFKTIKDQFIAQAAEWEKRN
ncbi:MAG: HD domain-containing protein [Candidatus Magasanikbacteria bacterium]|nr:HD domain-containing protein [Candidatus Magasanikbacteria bacterium]